MTQDTKENIRILYAEPNRTVRKDGCSALRHLGYPSIEETANYKGVEKAISENNIDLLICDANLGGQDIGKLIHKIRHQEFGRNPFFAAILITENLAADSIKKMIDCGVDDVLAKPLAPGFLADRIDALTWRRKGFVVTSDYIGPDRRSTVRPDRQKVPVITVPNALQYLAEGHTDLEQFQRMIDTCAQEVKIQKMARQAHQIDYLAKLILSIFSNEETKNDDTVPLLGRLSFFTKDLAARVMAMEMQQIGELCGALNNVITSILKDVNHPETKDLQVMAQLASDIDRAAKHSERK